MGHHNPKYAVIDELRREKLLLHSPMKDDADTVENSSSNYVYVGQEEQQDQDNVGQAYSVEQGGYADAGYKQETPYPTEQAGYAESEYQEDGQPKTVSYSAEENAYAETEYPQPIEGPNLETFQDHDANLTLSDSDVED